MSNSYHTKNGKTSKRGAFINGVWHCDCDPRLPAEKFQTKNGGKNHGRWYDAKIREESAVINNLRSEPYAPVEPQTPRKSTPPPLQQQTPFSKARSETISPELSSKPVWSHTKIGQQPENDFDWSSSGDEELASIAEAAANNEAGSPRKVARTLFNESPGKRKHTDMNLSTKSKQSNASGADIFTTPLMSAKSNGLLSPLDSRSKQTLHDDPGQLPSSLASEALRILKPVNIPPQIEQELLEYLNRHDLRTQGIIRGRDITRLAVQTKDKKISDLQERITALEAQKETSRNVIAHMKQDFATSPKRQSRSRFGGKSEV